MAGCTDSDVSIPFVPHEGDLDVRPRLAFLDAGPRLRSFLLDDGRLRPIG